jgi:prepilin-type N-terminal cleavage/methylation domain-containing protein
MTQISIKRILSANRPRYAQRGFTLMELLIVMSIMIIPMLIAIPNFISMAVPSERSLYDAPGRAAGWLGRLRDAFVSPAALCRRARGLPCGRSLPISG